MRCHTDSHLVESDRAFFSKNFAKIRFVHIFRGKVIEKAKTLGDR
jgi:hypothetical protein